MLIQCGQFSQGITEIYDLSNEQVEWEFFLHKVFDNSSFDAFRQSLREPQEMTAVDLETTVNKSRSLLQGFNPYANGG